MEGAEEKPLVYVFMGPPGVGKGTQARPFSESLGILHISTGDLLRDAAARGTSLGLEAKETFVDQGKLVPDEIMMQIVDERLGRDDCRRGVLLDGFPRTRPQADFLAKTLSRRGFELARVVYLDAPEEVVVDRLSGRRTCPSCGANFHLKNRPPQKEGRCDRCDSELIWRDDDRPGTLRRRMRVYREETADLVGYYETRGILTRVDGSRGIDEIQEAIQAVPKGGRR